jgi:hypothetical protein
LTWPDRALLALLAGTLCARWYGWPLAPPERIAGAAGPLADLAALISPGREISAVYDHDPGGAEARKGGETVRRRNRSSGCCDDTGVLIAAGRPGGLLAVCLDQALGELVDVARLGQVRAASWSLSSALVRPS